ncbi:FAD binding domain-containing protein [Lentinula aciculospora]|uniref:FAD binding domain-containing protein n=1 Tax=Lentinula aciculospora TaxID=153920 RepID=A0A9W9DP16_9AGAR|nr:FAD binding domain-containing protein [Lentinula aciculospora]
MSSTSVTPSVLIVGAGPAGSVLALTLLKNGIPVRIVDKEGPQIGQKGLGVQPRSLEMHHFLGTLPDFLSIARRLPVCNIYKTPGGTEILKTIEIDPFEEPTPDSPYINSLMLGQHRQQSILHRHLEKYGCKAEFLTEMRSFQQFDDHVLATLVTKDQDGTEISETVKVPYLVGTDGAHSTVRKALGLNFLGETRDDVNMIIGDIHVKGGLERKFWHSWGEPSKLVALIPTEVDDDIFTFMIGGTESDQAKTASGRDELVKTISFITDRTDIDFGELVWISRYRPNIRMVDKFGEGRVFVAGDAAHIHSPTGGQGTNSGVQDSFNLGWKLALVLKGVSPSSLLATYTEERLPVIAAMLDKSTLLLNRSLAPSPVQGHNWERGKEFKQLGVNYRGSSTLVDETIALTQDLTPTDSYSLASDGVIHAGDRAPQAPSLETLHSNRNHSPALTSLFDIFGPDHHTLLVFGSSKFNGEAIASELSAYPQNLFKTVLILPTVGTSESELSDLVTQTSGVDLLLRDRDGYAHKYYPALPGPSTLVVVRPDGVVGAIVGGVEGLHQYLKGVFLTM